MCEYLPLSWQDRKGPTTEDCHGTDSPLLTHLGPLKFSEKETKKKRDAEEDRLKEIPQQLWQICKHLLLCTTPFQQRRGEEGRDGIATK